MYLSTYIDSNLNSLRQSRLYLPLLEDLVKCPGTAWSGQTQMITDGMMPLCIPLSARSVENDKHGQSEQHSCFAQFGLVITRSILSKILTIDTIQLTSQGEL